MAACVALNAQNLLEVIVTPVGDCTSYVILDAAEYWQRSIFDIPDGTTLAGFFSAGFTLPMAVGLIAWAVGKLVNSF